MSLTGKPEEYAQFTLDAEENLVLSVYRFFDWPGVERLDGPDFLGFKHLKLRELTGPRAQELIQRFRNTEAGTLAYFRLTLGSAWLADFASGPPGDWFIWEAVDEAARGGRLCAECSSVLADLRADLDAHKLGAPWPGEDPLTDTLSELDALDGCQTCGPLFELAAALNKSRLVEEYLLTAQPVRGAGVSATLWYDPESMCASFESFRRFMMFVSDKARQPVALFFYQSAEPYAGDFFRIISLTDHISPPEVRAARVAEQLSAFTPRRADELALLREKQRRESRPTMDEQRAPLPSVFLQHDEKLAAYPSHPLFGSGPLRALVVHTVMGWLAESYRWEGDTAFYALPSDADNGPEVPLEFNATDVRCAGVSIFQGAQDWSALLGRVAHEVSESVGNRLLRACWVNVLKKRGSDDFEAARFFDTLDALYNDHQEAKSETAKAVESSPECVDILVTVDLKKEEICFILNSASRHFIYKDVGGMPLNDPAVGRVFKELGKLASWHLNRVLVPDPVNMGAQIPSIVKLKMRGTDLWRNFIPDNFKRAYVTLRKEEDLTLFIVSEDPSFPWELVRPFETQGDISPEVIQDLWWAVKFSIARWLSTSPPPARHLSLKRICCIAAGELAAAARERDFLRKLGAVCDLPENYEQMISFLGQNDYDVVHFACHGRFDQVEPGESAIMLPGGARISPKDLMDDDVILKFKQNHPLVFLNSCHSGRTGPTFTGLGGWAKEFIGLECGAFIGCGWEVHDELAADFAIAFYSAFAGGMKLGQSVHTARQEIMKKDGTNSTWLAYYLYGNPSCGMKK
jgi:CHAT domain